MQSIIHRMMEAISMMAKISGGITQFELAQKSYGLGGSRFGRFRGFLSNDGRVSR